MQLYRMCLLSVLSVTAGAALTLTACDSPTAPSESPNLVVQLTDDHTQQVDKVNVYFTTVTAKPVDGPTETLDLELTTNPQDLLVLQDTVITLATGDVPVGEYDFLMINLDEAMSHLVLLDGDQVPVRLPSEEIKILGGFEVADETTTTITLDFDAEQSLVSLGNGGWLLKPVIIRTVAGP